ncbi:MAG: hypothetical protein ACYC9R_08235 [Nitrosotalea sp.]
MMQNNTDSYFVTCLLVHSALKFVQNSTFAASPTPLQKPGWIQVFSNLKCTVHTIDRLGYANSRYW